MLDILIYKVASIALVASFIASKARFPAVLVGLSMAANVLAYMTIEDPSNPSWNELVTWLALVAIKDLLLLTLFGLRRNPRELIILLSFAVSCLFHQGILAQVLTYESKNLTLFAIRPQVMLYVSVAQLATVFYIILTGSGINGGKRKCAKRNILDFHHNLNRVFHVQASKVKR